MSKIKNAEPAIRRFSISVLLNYFFESVFTNNG